MISWGIFGVLFVLSAVITVRMAEDPDEIIGGIAMGFFSAMAFVAIGSMIVSGVLPKQYYEHSRTELVALKDNTGISGSFFLGSGNINSTMKYYYLVNSEFGLEMRSVEAGVARIQEKDDESPHLRIMKKQYADPWIRGKIWNLCPARENIYVFVIPPDSVLRDYRVDLE